MKSYRESSHIKQELQYKFEMKNDSLLGTSKMDTAI